MRPAAPKALQGKDYGVREQFPVEIENERRVPNPIIKRCKQNSQNKVVLARDKLYMNDVQCIPSDSEINRNDNKQNDNKRYERGYQRERVQVQTADINVNAFQVETTDINANGLHVETAGINVIM